MSGYLIWPIPHGEEPSHLLLGDWWCHVLSIPKALMQAMDLNQEIPFCAINLAALCSLQVLNQSGWYLSSSCIPASAVWLNMAIIHYLCFSSGYKHNIIFLLLLSLLFISITITTLRWSVLSKPRENHRLHAPKVEEPYREIYTTVGLSNLDSTNKYKLRQPCVE